MRNILFFRVMAVAIGIAVAAPAFLDAQLVTPGFTSGGTGSSAPTAGPVDGPPPPTATPPTSGGPGGTNSVGCGGVTISRDSPLVIPAYNPLCLIQPLDDSTYILESRGGIQIAFDYFNLSFPWLAGVAAGVALLQGIVAGIQIMYGGSPETVDEGKTRFYWALGGMLLLGLSGVILRALNPIFYR